MDRIDKFLKRLSQKERDSVIRIVERALAGDFEGIDVKKLKGVGHIFRARKGDIRILFEKLGATVRVLAITRRNENTYRDL